MSNLEALKEKLKHKPEVRPNEGVRVILAPLSSDKKGEKQTIITADKDNGKRAQEILEKIKQNKLSNVIKKKVEEPKVDIVSKVPEKEKDMQKEKAKKLKKLSKDTIVLVEEPEKNPIDEQNMNVEEGQKEGEEEQQEGQKEEEVVINPKKRSTKKVIKGVIELGPEHMIKIGDTRLEKRLPSIPVFDMKVSSYYMNNREIFVNFINDLFKDYKDDLLDESKGISCEDIGKDTGKVSLLTHQKIVRDYMNLYSPYRGLLLYHGLGSGKTCTSIGIAEGMKSARKVIIMTPASLKRNYMEEIKKCGDLLYRKNQYWEWISADNNEKFIEPLSVALRLPKEYIKRNHGAWLVNIRKSSNYTELSSSDKKVLNDQLDEMINNKYRFINYNGLTRNKFAQLTNNFEDNIFDNAVVIIDEAHNLISRIVNKINSISKYSEKTIGPAAPIPQSLSLILYDFLQKADNCRVVLLTGTPIINYPNEIGVLFNILRGFIKTWNFTLNNDTNKKLSKETLQEIFAREKVMDYIEYIPSSKTLTVTRNPYGFENKITSSGYKGVTNEQKEKRNDKGEIERDSKGRILYNERGQIKDNEFVQRIVKLLKKNDINAITNGTTYTVQKALPDDTEGFINNFIIKDTDGINLKVINVDKFKRRIIGLTSYFRSAQEELLPSYDRNFDRHEVHCAMSDYQFKMYENYRHEERKVEKPNKKSAGTVNSDGIFKEPSSTYRIFSRLACNFVMPTPPGRPNPGQYRMIEEGKKSEKIFDLMKEKYFKNKDEYDEDIKIKLNEFYEAIPEEKLKNSENQKTIKHILDKYLTEYITQHYRSSIKEFAESMGLGSIFNKIKLDEQNPKEKEKEKPNKTSKEKEEAKLAKEKEREIKEQTKLAKEREKEEKEQAKAAKEREKEQAKAAKEREKEEKEQAKAAKEREKEEKEREKAAKKREKEEKEREKAEAKAEKERRKAEKLAKGGNLDEDEDEEEEDDEEKEEDKEEEELIGGGEDVKENPAEKFINEHDEEEVNSIHLENYKDEDAMLRETEELEGDEILEKMGNVEYKEAIKSSMRYLQIHSQEYLSPEGLKTYSPKYLAMLNNIDDPEHKGLHLIYSQFRSMEGIGIFCLVLEANGFAKFKIKRTGTNGWEINMSEEDMGKPCYALYTGTEDAEEREILRNIYNGTWDYIPNNIATQLKAKSSNNNLGEIVKILMITSAGSEGINLRNTRYVHIMEPYWHPVRVEQVIGRARRICSHQSLPKELQTVEVFIYIMTFTKQQLDSDFAIELKLKDLSKNSPYLPQTSDEKLYEISTIKEQLTTQLLRSVKESSIDCATHIQSSTKEGLVCLSFGSPNVTDFSYNPNYSQDENDNVANLNKEKIDWEAKPFTFKQTGKRYMLRMDTRQVYDYDSVIQAKQLPGVRPILIGKLVKNSRGDYEIVKEKV